MAKIMLQDNLNISKNYSGKVISDPTYNEGKTILRMRIADNLLGITDAVIYGDRKEGKTLPIEATKVAGIVKGANLKYDFRVDINPTEKEGKKYLNEHIVLLEWGTNEVPTTEMSGKVFFYKDETAPRANKAGDRMAYQFQIALYRGKDADGNYRPSHFVDVVYFGDTLPECVKDKAPVNVYGRITSDPRTVDVQQADGSTKKMTYPNRRLVAYKIEPNVPVEVDAEAVKAAARASAAAAPQEPAYEPQPVGDEDMPY